MILEALPAHRSAALSFAAAGLQRCITYILFTDSTGIVVSTLIMPRKEWEDRPFLTPFQYNVNKEGITL
jgi:hypothetical protein